MNDTIAMGNASAIFKGKSIEGDGHNMWSALAIEFNRKSQRQPEAQHVRAELDELCLNIRSNDHLHSSKFKEDTKRLLDLSEANSENAHVE